MAVNSDHEYNGDYSPSHICMGSREDAVYLGTLGFYKWFRCRDCGAEWSRKDHRAVAREEGD